MTPHLLADLAEDEGLVLSAYPDPLSPLAKACRAARVKPAAWRDLPGAHGLSGAPWTIGCGHTGPDVTPETVWPLERARAQLAADLAAAVRGLDKALPWWRRLDDVRQDVLANMAFNLGIARLLGFHNTLAAMKRGDWASAAAGMEASLWAHQVGDRAARLADQIREGAPAKTTPRAAAATRT